MLVEFIEVGPGLVLATEQERVEVQDAADRRVRGVLVAAVDERETEAMDADRGGEPRCLLDDAGLAEDVCVELGGLVGVAVAPDGGSDELSHVDTVA